MQNQSTRNTSLNKIGLVLSGGGARGIAHAGILQALEEKGIHPTHLSGSSIGAIVGALYAAQFPPKEILHFFKINTTIFKWNNFTFTKPGILDADKYESIFEPWLHGHTFETLSKELHICVTDILEGKVHYFSTGELVRPILASAAVPGVFTPVEINNTWYVDGGTMDNFPIEPLKNNCDLLIGSFVSSKKKLKKSELTNTLKIINRATELSHLAGSKIKFPYCDFLLAPPALHQYGIFDTHKIDEMYEIGYKYAKKQLAEKDFYPYKIINT